MVNALGGLLGLACAVVVLHFCSSTNAIEPSNPTQVPKQHAFSSYVNTTATYTQDVDDVRTPWTEKIRFLVDYYPSQWPREMWARDASRMANASITHVRISEFDWALLEPSEGNYDWSLLDDSIEVLAQYGLKVILGTPTCTPPMWVVRKYDILGVNDEMHVRRFGSRRHYSFSSPDYLALSKGIVRAMAERYGDNENVDAWQLDNEFGNTRTTRTYDQHATRKFRQWLQDKYGTIEELNNRQGRVFWSSQYDTFDDILPPTLENEESSPALRLDWFHFSSDQLISFSAEQAETVREVAREQGYKAKPITTNFMCFEFSFDHYKFMQETGIDFATWDSYPLGNGDVLEWAPEHEKLLYARTGRPDHQALQHSFFRGVAGVRNGNQPYGPWGVMESPLGPVNWAPANPSPAPGIVRLWLHDMTAHGSSLNGIFRWRQVPYGQEQMHSGMLRPDDEPDFAFGEHQAAVSDIEQLHRAKVNLAANNAKHAPKIAMIFDYPSHWFIEAQPQSGRYVRSTYVDYTFQYPELFSNWFSALRRLALDVDVIGPTTNLSSYDLVLIPTMVNITTEMNAALAEFKGDVIVGPRTSSKVDPLSIPDGLAPAQGALRDRLPLKVTRSESLHRNGGLGDKVRLHSDLCGSQDPDQCVYPVEVWSEWLECEREGKKAVEFVSATYEGYRDGKPAMCSHIEESNDPHVVERRTTYLGWYAKQDALMPIFVHAAKRRGIKTLLGQEPNVYHDLGKHVRFARRGDALFAFNYDDKNEADLVLPRTKDMHFQLLVGHMPDHEHKIAKSGVNIYRIASNK
ncbi:uncharacterized protein FA14DRAFT_92243 [Meira miltonrushii]|uniref:beta-galactosidase n=1 Tax=Meira miltonrushii TaxID=1280837 RepID=A0A316V2C0_9BASI|nr:uncharacterized protein FA14DRAFT_92243 [Meira miltonrushii]PWN31696.1 hypothetical protein FA14DRAFT_92243 [Meira miltonrushii]